MFIWLYMEPKKRDLVLFFALFLLINFLIYGIYIFSGISKINCESKFSEKYYDAKGERITTSDGRIYECKNLLTIYMPKISKTLDNSYESLVFSWKYFNSQMGITNPKSKLHSSIADRIEIENCTGTVDSYITFFKKLDREKEREIIWAYSLGGVRFDKDYSSITMTIDITEAIEIAEIGFVSEIEPIERGGALGCTNLSAIECPSLFNVSRECIFLPIDNPVKRGFKPSFVEIW